MTRTYYGLIALASMRESNVTAYAFHGRDLYYIRGPTGNVFFQVLPTEDRLFSNLDSHISLSVLNVSLIACDKNVAAFCVIYRYPGELCRLSKTAQPPTSSCLSIALTAVQRLALLSELKLAVYGKEQVELYSLASGHFVLEATYQGTDLRDVGIISSTKFILCTSSGLYVVSAGQFAGPLPAKVPKSLPSCDLIRTYGKTIVAYRNVAAAKETRSFMAEFRITDSAQGTLSYWEFT